jgi:hypothetical protein
MPCPSGHIEGFDVLRHGKIQLQMIRRLQAQHIAATAGGRNHEGEAMLLGDHLPVPKRDFLEKKLKKTC